MEFLKQIEEAESLLKIKYNLPNISAENKKLIENLFVFLKERQSISSAALEVEDAFVAIQEEKVELHQRDKELFQSLSNWMTTIQEFNFNEQKCVMMEYYAEVARGCHNFIKMLKRTEKYKKRVKLELDALNACLENFNEQVQAIGVGAYETYSGLFKIPKKQMKRVTKATEAAFEEIDVLNKTVRRLSDKLDVIEEILKSPEKFQLEPSSSSSTPGSTDTDSSTEETESNKCSSSSSTICKKVYEHKNIENLTKQN